MPRLSLMSPVGELTLVEQGGRLVALTWGPAEAQAETALLKRTRRQLDRYFAGQPAPFDLPLGPQGSPFQRRVWELMRAIPACQTRTYCELARDMRSAPRAVGGACAKNPIPIIIPCHRVVAASGLGGYSAPGGRALKRTLLSLEGAPF